ncbi:hypothetical protein D3C85_15980 [compost metagenome]
MGDHSRLLNLIRRKTTTHDCPSCSKPTYCAMEDGKSGNLCWCMNVKAINLAETDQCLCKTCLMNELDGPVLI